MAPDRAEAERGLMPSPLFVCNINSDIPEAWRFSSGYSEGETLEALTKSLLKIGTFFRAEGYYLL